MKQIDSSELNALPLGRILGIDYGSRRVGLAVSDPSQMLTSTLCTFQNKGEKLLVNDICDVVKQQNAVAIVIGNPLHMDGRESEMAVKASQLAVALKDKTGLPSFSWDERWTTASAEKLMIESGRSPSRNRQKIDQIAAAYMLQSFLDRLSFVRRQAPVDKS